MIIDLLRLIIGGSILLYASYTDWKYREASNKLWLIMGIAGLFLLFSYDFSDFTKIGFSLLISFPLGFLLYLFGMGGADVKAIWAIAILSPLPPNLKTFPLWIPAIPFYAFPLAVLINSLFLFLPLPLIFLLYNIYRKDVEFPYCFFGYKMKASEAKKKYVWPMEKNGKKSILPQKEADLSIYGEKEIWVTPKVPFLIFICAGYIISFIFGDFLFAIFSLFQ